MSTTTVPTMLELSYQKSTVVVSVYETVYRLMIERSSPSCNRALTSSLAPAHKTVLRRHYRRAPREM